MAASLHSLSLTPQTLSLHHSSSAAVSASSLFAPVSLKPLPKLVLSLSSAATHGQPASRFVRNVAISSVEEGDDESFDSGSEEQNFGPELKLFVGNLPFNVDSAALAGLFEQAGNVEMVEVISFFFLLRLYFFLQLLASFFCFVCVLLNYLNFILWKVTCFYFISFYLC